MKLTCTNYSIILEKIFSIEHTEIQILRLGLVQTSHFRLLGINPHNPESHHGIHIYCEI